VKAVKVAKFAYESSSDVHSLLTIFARMCNDAIRIALENHSKSRFDLIEVAYKELKNYGLHTHYILSACEIAFSLCRNRNPISIPYIRKPFLKLDKQSFNLDYLILRIPVRPREFIYITLEGSSYHRSFLSDPTLKTGSVTITESAVIVSFSKDAKETKPIGYIGLDVNEKNVTAATGNCYVRRFDELSEVAEIKERYKEIRAEIGRATRGDRRISKRLYAKYGKREKNRTIQRINKISGEVVNFARENRLGIKMERLDGIRKLYRKGNGQTRLFRGRMNSWSFHEVQRQIEYKARWDGIPVYYVNPRGTSRNCPDCGSRVAPLQERKLYCSECDKTWDRDVLAARNIAAAAVPAARPPRGSCEEES